MNWKTTKWPQYFQMNVFTTELQNKASLKVQTNVIVSFCYRQIFSNIWNLTKTKACVTKALRHPASLRVRKIDTFVQYSSFVFKCDISDKAKGIVDKRHNCLKSKYQQLWLLHKGAIFCLFKMHTFTQLLLKLLASFKESNVYILKGTQIVTQYPKEYTRRNTHKPHFCTLHILIEKGYRTVLQGQFGLQADYYTSNPFSFSR